MAVKQAFESRSRTRRVVDASNTSTYVKKAHESNIHAQNKSRGDCFVDDEELAETLPHHCYMTKLPFFLLPYHV